MPIGDGHDISRKPHVEVYRIFSCAWWPSARLFFFHDSIISGIQKKCKKSVDLLIFPVYIGNVKRNEMNTNRSEIMSALEAKGLNACFGKGGFFIQGQGWISMAAARRLTGIQAEPRVARERIAAYGDYAWIAAINRVK